MRRAVLWLVPAILLWACNPVEKSEPSSSPPAATSAPAMERPMGGAEPPAQPTTQQGSNASVEELAQKYNEAKAAYSTDPSEKNKSSYVAAAVAYGTAVMTGQDPPRVKYPKALELYEEALALDPSNEEAKTNRQLILDIYKSMGKEPPKSGG